MYGVRDFSNFGGHDRQDHHIQIAVINHEARFILSRFKRWIYQAAKERGSQIMGI